MAALWRLPVVFICENNHYGMSTSIERSTAVERIAQRATAYDMPGLSVDGNDFFAVADAASEAVERARAGQGPTLLECMTYRHRGHSKSDRNRYRTKEEIESWLARDPIERFKQQLLDAGLVDARQIAAVHREVAAQIDEAIEFAKASPEPTIEHLTDFVYSPSQAGAPEHGR
jgi:pyruvate dehydrogenase E1 component alpha subunit